jgi:hypothetical protein
MPTIAPIDSPFLARGMESSVGIVDVGLADVEGGFAKVEGAEVDELRVVDSAGGTWGGAWVVVPATTVVPVRTVVLVVVVGAAVPDGRVVEAGKVVEAGRRRRADAMLGNEIAKRTSEQVVVLPITW